jgi:hypothetical protein
LDAAEPDFRCGIDKGRAMKGRPLGMSSVALGSQCWFLRLDSMVVSKSKMEICIYFPLSWRANRHSEFREFIQHRSIFAVPVVGSSSQARAFWTNRTQHRKSSWILLSSMTYCRFSDLATNHSVADCNPKSFEHCGPNQIVLKRSATMIGNDVAI